MAKTFSEILKDGSFLIDRSHLIYDFHTNINKYFALFAPRRFGKTMFLILLKYFYSANTWEEFGPYFQKLNLGNPAYSLIPELEKKEFIEGHGGKYRVIHFNFSGVKDFDESCT